MSNIKVVTAKEHTDIEIMEMLHKVEFVDVREKKKFSFSRKKVALPIIMITVGIILSSISIPAIRTKAEYEIRFDQFQSLLREEELFKDATDEELEKEFKVWLNHDGYLDICLDKENNCLVKIDYSGDNPDWQPK